MDRLSIQIYEIQEPQEADTLIDIGVDGIGSVLTSPENWDIPSVKETVDLVKQRGARSSLIPLFSDQDQIFKVIDHYEPHVIHLCESLSGPGGLNDKVYPLIRLQQNIKASYPELSIMRSIPIGETGHAGLVPTLELARLFEPVSDLFLTDTLMIGQGGNDADQPVQGFVGITGETCDWEMSVNLIDQSLIPVILAGGLSPLNVYDAVCATRPYGVDSCTRTNQVDSNGKPVRFKKDLDKVSVFVNEAKRAERHIREKQNLENKG